MSRTRDMAQATTRRGGATRPTPRRWPNSSPSFTRSASGSGGCRIEFDVGAQVPGIAGAEQHDVDAGLVPYKRYAASVRLLAPPACSRNPSGSSASASHCGHLPACRQFPHRSGKRAGAGEDAAHHEHQQRADAMLPA